MCEDPNKHNMQGLFRVTVALCLVYEDEAHWKLLSSSQATNRMLLYAHPFTLGRWKHFAFILHQISVDGNVSAEFQTEKGSQE